MLRGLASRNVVEDGRRGPEVPTFSVEEVARSKHQPRTCSVFGSLRRIASYNKVRGTQCGGYLNRATSNNKTWSLAAS